MYAIKAATEHNQELHIIHLKKMESQIMQKEAEKRNYEQRIHWFKQGHPPKWNGGSL